MKFEYNSLFILFYLMLEQIFRIQVKLVVIIIIATANSEHEMTSDIPYTINIFGEAQIFGTFVYVLVCVRQSV